MAATHAVQSTFSIEPYNPVTANWTRWLQRLEGAFKIFEIKDEARVPYLLHYVGAAAFEVLCDRLAPADPFEQTYQVIKEKLQQYYAPPPLEIAENYKFNLRKQQDGESVQDFVSALHKLSLHCNFGDYLRTAIRNQLVFGLSNKRTQARLLEVKDLTLDKATQIATSMELSEKGTEELHGEAKVSVVQAKKTNRKALNTNKQNKMSKNNNFVPPKQTTSGTSSSNYTRSLPNSNVNSSIRCYRCGRGHLASKCTLDLKTRCTTCGKPGHLRKVCFSQKQEANHLEEILTMEHPEFRQKFETTLRVNNKPVKFEVDTGAAVSVMGIKLARSLFPGTPIRHSNLKLISFCDKEIETLGLITVTVQNNSDTRELNLYLTNSNRGPLLGCEWILQLRHWEKFRELLACVESMNTVEMNTNSRLHTLLEKYKEIQLPGVAKITGIKAKLTLKEHAHPVFLKARPVLFKLIPMVEEELKRLETTGILEKVDASDWATPIVPVLKSNKQIRICGDFSVTLNPQLVVDEHPLPTSDELCNSMANGRIFSKIDLRQAYLQLEVREEDKPLLTLNTSKGLYCCNRLMYGIASAPAIWQRTIETILSDIPGVVVFLDDVRIAGSSEEDHLQKLEEVFKRFQRYNIRINVEKSEFCTDKIYYCGYVIDRYGLHKAPEKMKAIKEMRKPENKTEVRSFLGMITYYGNFIPNLSEIVFPLNQLLRKEVDFSWTEDCERAFRKAKDAFQSPRCLTHFNSKLPLVLATDASSYGVGAVLSHIFPDGSEKVIKYARHKHCRKRKGNMLK